MRLLVTNDDGVEAPGIAALAAACAAAGHEVVVAAPARQASGSAAAILVDDDATEVRVGERRLPGLDVPVFAVGAAPAMCVLLGLRERFGPEPHAVLSGVNDGANLGRVLLHSGTVGAALTAGVNGRRALAVSLDVRTGREERRWAVAAEAAVRLLPVLEAEPAGTVLNLNVPNTGEAARFVEAPLDPGGVVHTTASDADSDDGSVRLALAEGGVPLDGTDADLLAEGWSTVTAIVPPAAVRLHHPLS